MQFSSYTVPNHSNGSFSFQLLCFFSQLSISFLHLSQEDRDSHNPTALSPFSFTPPIQYLLSCPEMAEKGLFTPPIRICHVRHLMRKQYTLSHRIITQLKLKSSNTVSDQKPLRGETAPTPNPFHLLLSSDYRSYTPPPRRRSEPALTHPTSRFVLISIYCLISYFPKIY